MKARSLLSPGGRPPRPPLPTNKPESPGTESVQGHVSLGPLLQEEEKGMLVSSQALGGPPSLPGSGRARRDPCASAPPPPGRGAVSPRCPGWGGPPLPARSCLGLDHGALSCQSSRGYPEWGRTSQNPLRNLRH